MIYKRELANKVENGAAVGNLYGVGEYFDSGRRRGWVLQPQENEDLAALVLAEFTRQFGDRQRPVY